MRSGTELNQFLRVLLTTHRCGVWLFIVLLVRFKSRK